MRSTMMLVLCCLAGCAAANSPEQLAQEVQAALDRGDLEGFAAHVDFTGTPALFQEMLLETVVECSSAMRCTVSLTEADSDFDARLARLAEEGIELAHPVAGLLEIKAEARQPGDQAMPASTSSAPYALVEGRYRIINGRYTATRLAELQATSALDAVKATLQRGVLDPATMEVIPDWSSQALSLAEGGGEVGEAWLARIEAVSAAVQAGDPDAAWEASGAWGRRILSPTDYFGNPIPMEVRKRLLRTEALGMVATAQVLAGFQLDDLALLVIEGRNGAGNTLRGAMFVKRTELGWDHAGTGDHLIEIPAG
ncbi:MAG: hypothetical protein KDI51_02375 [Xanthomonadales bacterium]|nr:hypothetical protein [Xanthomonadales bacterium]